MLYFLHILTTIVLADGTRYYESSRLYQPDYQSQYKRYDDNRGYDNHRKYDSSYASPYRQMQPSTPKLTDVEIMNAKIDVLNEIREAVYRSHEMCHTRAECRGMDTQILSSIQAQHQRDSHLSSFFRDFDQQLSKAFNLPAATEWDIYNSLSEAAKRDYQAGVRINDPKAIKGISFQDLKLDLKYQRKTSVTPPKFNLDELKMYILQQFETSHQSCTSRDACLQSDNRIIDSVIQLLGQEDPARNDLTQLKDAINERAKNSFDTKDFVEAYYQAMINKTPLLYREKDRMEWIKLAKTFKIGQRRNPQVLNQQQMEEQKKPGNELTKHVKETANEAGKKAVDDLFGAVLGKKGDQKDLGLFGKLFGR